MTDAQQRAALMQRAIEAAGIAFRLNLTVHEGKIGFVDQKERKIVALWEPKYTLPDKEGDSNAE